MSLSAIHSWAKMEGGFGSIRDRAEPAGRLATSVMPAPQSGRSYASRASEWVTNKERVESYPVSDWLTNRAGLEFLLELRAAEQALGE
jgi:hypothetical protein